METWAYCRPCSRWWYCPEAVIEDMADAACPICLAPAARFEDRPKLKVAAIQVD